MIKVIGMFLLLVGTSVILLGNDVPEIDPVSGISVLALLSGGFLMVRGRRQS